MAGSIQRRNVTLCTSQIRQKEGTVGEAIGGRKELWAQKTKQTKTLWGSRTGEEIYHFKEGSPNRSLGISEVRPRRAPALCSGPRRLGLRDTEIMFPPPTELGPPGEADTRYRGKVHRAGYSELLGISIGVARFTAYRMSIFHRVFRDNGGGNRAACTEGFSPRQTRTREGKSDVRSQPTLTDRGPALELWRIILATL